jgi:hypothetical protein
MNITDVAPVALAEALARLQAMPAFLSSALGSVAPADLARQPRPGEF